MRYDSTNGTRLTDCCGAYSTYIDGVLSCKGCYEAVPVGQGDGTEKGFDSYALGVLIYDWLGTEESDAGGPMLEPVADCLLDAMPPGLLFSSAAILTLMDACADVLSEDYSTEDAAEALRNFLTPRIT